MGWNQQQVEAAQNASPTDFTNFDQQLVNKSSWDLNRFADDSKLHVRFYSKPRLNPDKSAIENRAIYEDTDYIEIMIPGDKHNIIQRPCWEQDLQRFPVHYEKYKKGQAQVVGTPLAAVPFLTQAQVEEFAFFQVRTVEHLAGINDAVIGKFMGGHTLKAQAKAWLEKSTSGETLLAKINEKDEEIKALQSRLAALEADKALENTAKVAPPKK